MANLSQGILSEPLLLVGCGGIGCEVIKNLVLLGFNNVTLIDLDTIDVSNLNRQFLFNKKHINQSKAIVSSTVASDLFANGRNENLKLEPIHGSILVPDYDVEYFKKFTFVINALDNRQARSHVNRMCLAADVPLIESGSEGYLGQTFMIKKNVTACYECNGPVPDQKTFPSCTIRNTPSLPIHCIVWAKHLFNQLFGEEDDPDNDVSPDFGDPEVTDIPNKELKDMLVIQMSNEDPQSTKKWAANNDYDPVLLFDKFFRIDIEYLHKMDKLWEHRTKPVTLKYDQLDDQLPNTSSTAENGSDKNGENFILPDQKVLNLRECFELFSSCLEKLKKRLETEEVLIWDKDDETALEFVTAVSNLRSFCFHIERKSKFDVKSMAGNIIPAISSTNSIIGGIMVLQLINILRKLDELPTNERKDKKVINELFKSTAKHVFLRRVSTNVNNLIASYDYFQQNPKCLVCCTKNIPEIEVNLNLNQVTMSEFVEQFLLRRLSFVCPDIQLDGQPTIIWSREDYEDYSESDKEEYKTKSLIKYPLIRDKVRLKVYDLVQNLSVIITLKNEEFNLNQNDGLFYKMKITTEADETEENANQDEEIPTTSGQASDSAKESDDILIEVDSQVLESEEKVKNGRSTDSINNATIDKTDDKITVTEIDIEKTGGLDEANEIVLVDSDDENSTLEQQLKNKEIDNSGCQIIEDDDDLELIDVKQGNEKRKIDDNESERHSKKPRIDHQETESV